MEDGFDMPYSIAVNYRAKKPDSSEQCPLELALKLSKSQLSEGEATQLRVELTNKQQDKEQGGCMPTDARVHACADVKMFLNF